MKPYRKLSATPLQKADKLKRKTAYQEIFYEECRKSAQQIHDLCKPSISETKKLCHHLQAKRKTCSRAWTVLDTLIRFGCEWEKKHYGPTQEMLDQDKNLYILMGIVAKELDMITTNNDKDESKSKV